MRSAATLGARAIEGWLALLLVLAPWPFGSTPDAARYALAAGLLLGGAAWWLGCTESAVGRRALLLWSLPALALAQVVFGTSVAPVWTLEAGLVLAAMVTALLVWRSMASSPARARRLAWVILGTALAQALFGIVQWSQGSSRIYGRTSPIVTTPFGSFVNHNHFACMMAMAIPLALGMALGHVRRAGGPTPTAVSLGGMALLLTTAHLASRSRGGLLALVAGLAALVIAWHVPRPEEHGRRRVAVLLALLLGVMVFGWWTVPTTARARLLTLLEGPSDASGSYRVDMAVASARLALSSPVTGSGLGAYADAIPPFKRGHGEVRTTHAESDVMEIIAEGGGVGLIALGCAAFALVACVPGRLRERGDPVRRGISAGALAGACALMVHSLVDFNLRIPSNALMFSALLALASSPLTEGYARRSGARFILTTLCLALAGAATWRAAGAVAFERALDHLSPAVRVAELTEVLDGHPYMAAAWRARAAARMAQARVGSGLRDVRLEVAAGDLRQALRLRPHWGEARGDLANVLRSLGDCAEARHELERAVLDDPTHAGLLRLARGPAPDVCSD